MKSKITLILFLILSFFILLVFYPKNVRYSVKSVVSPIEIVIENHTFKYDDMETFDNKYTEHNKKLASLFNLTENDTFILGNLGVYWAKNILQGHKVCLHKDDIIYHKFSYRARLENSPFCIKNNAPTNKRAFFKQINSVKKTNYVIVDTDTDKIYPISKENSEKIKNFVVVRKSHVKHIKNKEVKLPKYIEPSPLQYISDNIKLLLSDLTIKLKPDRMCNTNICKEILESINSANSSIDIAIYGYSSVPAIETALNNAIQRGVKVRLVYDSDKNGKNIYPNTDKIVKLIPQNISDLHSQNPEYIMHNKFYIFDNKKVITGSANLSHTDMSGFNSNAVIVINSQDIAKIYTNEFEQLYSNNFHNTKSSKGISIFKNYIVSFSPQDSTITNVILPAIKNAKHYIYIPSFVITEKRIVEELIKAKERGVDIKIILDALNASVKHSKSKELRQAGIAVKTENYAGKMHSKSIIIDDKYVIIGSMNFSNSGENKNDENVVLIENPNLTKFYKQFFLYQWAKIPDKWLKINARAESKDSIGSCSDGIDNDYDGLTDLDDEGCK